MDSWKGRSGNSQNAYGCKNASNEMHVFLSCVCADVEDELDFELGRY